MNNIGLDSPHLMHIFDSHAHYDDERFSEDVYELLDALPEKGVSGILSCGVNVESTRFAQALAQKYGYIYAAAGFHPLNLEDVPENAEAVLRDLLKDSKTVAVGEIGLAYHYEKESREKQLALFEMQLRLAKELNLPVIVHAREAHEDTLKLLKKIQPTGVIHCFTGSVETAKEILKLDMYIGLGGAVTFKNAVKPVEVAAMVPAERLLLETDAPYMTPVPFRGKRCDSSHIAYTAARIAEIRGVDTQTLCEQAERNTRRLFRI